MRTLHVFLLLVLLASVIAPVIIAHPTLAQEKIITRTPTIIWKRVPLEKVVKALTEGDIDVYLFGVPPETAKELEKYPDIALYKAPAGMVDFILNPAPVIEFAFTGDVRAKISDIASIFGLPSEATPYAYYFEETTYKGKSYTNVTFVGLCVRPDFEALGLKIEQWPDGTKYVNLTDYGLGVVNITFDSGQDINIFCFKEIRKAMNHLVDRIAIISSVYLGFGIPMWSFYSPADPTYTVLADIIAKYMAEWKYDVDAARSALETILTKVGATVIGGKWYFRGKPIIVRAIIRIEDERKKIGDMFASELERVGITVERVYSEFGPAITTVYYTCPEEFKWHIYTEGWGKGAIDKWDPWVAAQFAAPWFGFMPGWGDPSCWNYRHDDLDTWTKIACLGGFTSKDEWINLVRNATDVGTDESIRIWVATRLDITPARKDLEGVTLDLGAGLRNTIFNVRNWYVKGRDTIRVGHLWVWTGRTVWNVYGWPAAFTDVYSVDPARTTMDPSMWRHPFTGEPMPVRMNYTVETAGPTGTLDVPDDALWWNVTSDRWEPAKNFNRTKAVSKVVFDLSRVIGTHFHHGITITWADVLAAWAHTIEMAYDPEKASYEFVPAWVVSEFLAPIVAIRPLWDENKLEVYINYWHFDPHYIADMASFGVTNPVELLLSCDYLVYITHKFAASRWTARVYGVPQLNLVLPDSAAAVKEAAKTLKGAYANFSSWFEVQGKVLLTEDEWKSRLDALISWIDAHGHAWVSQGAFYLDSFDKDAQVLVLKRFEDPTYPIDARELYFGIPKLTEFVDIALPEYIIIGEPAIINITLDGAPPFRVYMLMIDPATAQIVYSVETYTETTTVSITIPKEVTTKLYTKTYRLLFLAISEKIALPASAVRDIDAVPAELAGIARQVAEMRKSMDELRGLVSSINASLGAAVADVFAKLSKSIESVANLTTSAYADLSKSIEDLKTDIDTLRGDVSKLKSSIEDTREVAASASDKVTTLTYLSSGLIGVAIVAAIVAAIRAGR